MYKSTGFLTNDRNQHYYGWAAYRQSAWQFPIGLFNTLTYPDNVSIYDEIKVLEQDSNVKNVIIWKSYLENENYNSLVPIYIWAVEHGMTVNYFYLARDDAQLYELRTEKALKDKRETDIIVFEIADEPLCIQEGLYYKIVGDYIFARTCPW